MPNETPCSKWNGEIQLEQPDCLRYLLPLLPVPRLRAAEPAGWHVVWPYTFENSRCWGKWFYCRSDLLPSPTKPLILKKGPVPQWLLLNYKINEILGKRGCVPRSSSLWLLFNKALTCLQPLTTNRTHRKGKARDNFAVRPCHHALPQRL